MTFNFNLLSSIFSRSLHKKCDRTLPNCLRCLQTNHLCFYPDKKRKKSESLDSLDSQHKSPTGTQPHQEPKKKKKSNEQQHHNSNNQMNNNPMINQLFGQLGGHVNNQMNNQANNQMNNQQSQMNITADNFSQNLQQLAQNMGLGLGHDMNEANPMNPLSLGLLSSKISSLNTSTQLQLLNMAANALSGNTNSLNNLISNIPAGILSAFTGGARQTPNVESVTPLVAVQNSAGHFQHSVKPITAFVLDIYFHTYSFGFPLIPKERMSALLDLVLLKQQQQLSSTVEMQQHCSIQIKTFYERVAKQFWSSAVDMEKDLAVFFAVLAATLQCSGNFVYQQYKNCANHLDLISSAGAAINLHQIGSQYESPLENTMGGSSINGTDSPHDDLFIQDLKNKWFNNSKNIIGKYFDDLDSMSIPIALTFLVYYLVGEGELQRARMYTNMVENLCQKVWSSMNCFGIGSRGFVNGSKPVVSTLSKISGSGGASSIMYGLPALLVHRYLRPIEIFLAEFEEPTNSLKRKLQNIGNKIRIDLTFIEDWENIKDHELEELERLIKFLNKYIDLLFSTMMNKESMLYITSHLTFHDVVMDVYKRAQTKNVDSLLRFAAEVIEITKIPLFTFLPTAFINTIMKAVQVRLAYGKPSENPNINLRDDMAALKLLSAKYPVITKLYGDTIREVETVLYLQSFSHSSIMRHILPEQPYIQTTTNNNSNSSEFDFEDNNFDILNFLNGEPSHGMSGVSGMNFDDELIGEIFGFSNLDNESTTSNTSCESIFIDGEKLEIPSCVKSGSFLPILIKNLSKQKEVLLQNDPNKSEIIKMLRTQLIDELTQHVGTDENTKLLIQLFTKSYVHK